MLFEASKGAVFFVCSLERWYWTIEDEKEGANNFRLMMIKRDLWKKDISIIVDVDDKNCLAESTVALKLTHGIRQWLYISAGVLFFGSFFCTSKRKNIIIY